MNYKLWYTFGLELGVPVKLLHSLTRYPESECMVEVVDYWLRNHHAKPTWSELENAIEECYVTINEGMFQKSTLQCWCWATFCYSYKCLAYEGHQFDPQEASSTHISSQNQNSQSVNRTFSMSTSSAAVVYSNL